VLRHLLEAACPPEMMVVTVQREVAERVVAHPPDMSLLAVSVQLYAQAEIVGRIPAGAFYPPPKVESAILRLRRRPALAVALAPGDVARFFAVVRAGFGQKRKQLHNSLAGGLHLPAVVVSGALAQAGIDGRRRAETLALEEWGRIVQGLQGAA
jgi:16S rRNA (adenine1518-N6/adenine1519-N6)-dimethyltransferase